MAALSSFDQVLRSRWLFARMFFKHPRVLGSVLPSSRFLADKLLSGITWSKVSVAVEYGPGVGNLTSEILDRLRPGAVLIAIEHTQEFVAFLRESIPDPRLRVVHGSAADVRAILARLGFDAADCVVSGIPLSTLPAGVRRDIIAETYLALRPSGVLLVYQFTRAVLGDLRRLFGSVHEQFEPRNILPARIFSCMRAEASAD